MNTLAIISLSFSFLFLLYSFFLTIIVASLARKFGELKEELHRKANVTQKIVSKHIDATKELAEATYNLGESVSGLSEDYKEIQKAFMQ